jgi:TrkA domain protein
VAVLREREVIPSPPPSFAFEAGDIVVVVGTRKALAEVTRILADDDPDG